MIAGAIIGGIDVVTGRAAGSATREASCTDAGVGATFVVGCVTAADGGCIVADENTGRTGDGDESADGAAMLGHPETADVAARRTSAR